jgi:hypothetical protein
MSTYPEQHSDDDAPPHPAHPDSPPHVEHFEGLPEGTTITDLHRRVVELEAKVDSIVLHIESNLGFRISVPSSDKPPTEPPATPE